jgi:hypothetical protein
MQPTGDHQNVLKIKPPLCIDAEAADFFVAMLDDALNACRSAADAFDCGVEVQRVFGATPTPFHPALVAAARHTVGFGRHAALAGGKSGNPVEKLGNLVEKSGNPAWKPGSLDRPRVRGA